MTQFTSFVAVEEMIVTDGGQPRRIDVPVEMPEGVRLPSSSDNITIDGLNTQDHLSKNVNGFFTSNSPSTDAAKDVVLLPGTTAPAIQRVHYHRASLNQRIIMPNPAPLQIKKPESYTAATSDNSSNAFKIASFGHRCD